MKPWDDWAEEVAQYIIEATITLDQDTPDDGVGINRYSDSVKRVMTRLSVLAGEAIYYLKQARHRGYCSASGSVTERDLEARSKAALEESTADKLHNLWKSSCSVYDDIRSQRSYIKSELERLTSANPV